MGKNEWIEEGWKNIKKVKEWDRSGWTDKEKKE